MGSTRCTTDNGVMSTRCAIKSLWATKSRGDATYMFRKLRSRRQTYNQRCFKTKVLNLIYDVAKSVTWQVWGAPSLPWAMLAPHQLARAISHDRNFCFQKSLVAFVFDCFDCFTDNLLTECPPWTNSMQNRAHTKTSCCCGLPRGFDISHPRWAKVIW